MCISKQAHTSNPSRQGLLGVAESLPDQMLNPGKYDPMLQSAVEHSVAEANEDKESGATRLFPVYTYESIKQLMGL